MPFVKCGDYWINPDNVVWLKQRDDGGTEIRFADGSELGWSKFDAESFAEHFQSVSKRPDLRVIHTRAPEKA